MTLVVKVIKVIPVVWVNGSLSVSLLWLPAIEGVSGEGGRENEMMQHSHEPVQGLVFHS